MMENTFMHNKYPLFPSILAGASAGAIVAVLILNNSDAFTPAQNRQQSSGTGYSSESISEYEKTVIHTVKEAQASVVSIVISQDVPIFEQTLPRNFNPLQDFFGTNGFPSIQQKGTE